MSQLAGVASSEALMIMSTVARGEGRRSRQRHGRAVRTRGERVRGKGAGLTSPHHRTQRCPQPLPAHLQRTRGWRRLDSAKSPRRISLPDPSPPSAPTGPRLAIVRISARFEDGELASRPKGPIPLTRFPGARAHREERRVDALALAVEPRREFGTTHKGRRLGERPLSAPSLLGSGRRSCR